MKKVIIINSGKRISIKNYVDAWKTLKSIPKDQRDEIEVKESLCTWYPVTVNECLKQYRDGVFDRINLRSKGLCKII